MRSVCFSLTATLVFQSAASAQDRDVPERLEELIPDEAVENPEAWATQGAPASPLDAEDVLEADTEGDVQEVAEEAAAAIDPGAPLPETPLANLPGLGLAWPDEFELAEIELVEPDGSVDLADLDEAPIAPVGDKDIFRVGDELALTFPDDDDAFPERTEFLERFESLSTIEELDRDGDNLSLLAARAREDEELLTRLLQIYGYYDAQIIRNVGEGPGDPDDAAAVRFDVVPGQRYRFGAVDLGALNEDAEAEAFRQQFDISSGDFLSSDRIVAEREELDIALGETGYPFARISQPSLLIDHDRREGDLDMPVAPGGRYAFGNITSNRPEFLSGEHLETIARFEEGDLYQRSLELDLRRAITATGIVSSVDVSVREVAPPVGDTPGRVALDVELTEAPLRTIAGAIGYGSEEGLRVQASWEHRNLFPPEGAFRVRGIIGTQEQLAGITLRKSNFGGRDRVLNLDAFASTIDSPAFDANTASFIATYEQTSTLIYQKPLSWSFGIELVATDERPAPIDGVTNPRETFFVAALPASALIDTTDSLLDPTRGFRLGGRLSPEISRNENLNQQSFFLRGQVDASTYRSVMQNVVLAARTRFASIPGGPTDNLAPSRRLYAGGGGSVRGYGYRQIGPSDALGETNGGRSLVEVSAEARIRTGLFDGAVSIVPFLDAGSVGVETLPDFETIRFGAGIGLRYHTSFGPIRVDVGAPLNPGPDDSPVAVYVSLGQAF
ncbi:BamA/TamA family outer membrane protein [Altererythrobacter aurantiacus]|uniref:BamA/TamA family outer membrane protein n=1 Tax=Parapontixanthobacter aurantiacus TaxID=1463599 RepID=A0A844ZC08_9SPHN|nr:BamA/TamA family outer membrane protein [Parapontixanthobacter aurantiacus]